TARGRWQVARRVIEDGETFAQAALAAKKDAGPLASPPSGSDSKSKPLPPTFVSVHARTEREPVNPGTRYTSRSRPPPPGRTSRPRRSGSGCGAGARQAGPSG